MGILGSEVYGGNSELRIYLLLSRKEIYLHDDDIVPLPSPSVYQVDDAWRDP
jgi:hypothetical protein